MNVSELRSMDPTEVVVELKPHTGVQVTKVGAVNTTLPQQVVYINGVWSGYVGNSPGAHISLIHSGLPASLVEVVKAKVDAIKGDVSSSIAQAASLEKNDVRLERAEEPSDSLADEDI